MREKLDFQLLRLPNGLRFLSPIRQANKKKKKMTFIIHKISYEFLLKNASHKFGTGQCALRFLSGPIHDLLFPNKVSFPVNSVTYSQNGLDFCGHEVCSPEDILPLFLRKLFQIQALFCPNQFPNA